MLLRAVLLLAALRCCCCAALLLAASADEAVVALRGLVWFCGPCFEGCWLVRLSPVWVPGLAFCPVKSAVESDISKDSIRWQ